MNHFLIYIAIFIGIALGLSIGCFLHNTGKKTSSDPVVVIGFHLHPTISTTQVASKTIIGVQQRTTAILSDSAIWSVPASGATFSNFYIDTLRYRGRKIGLYYEVDLRKTSNQGHIRGHSVPE